MKTKTKAYCKQEQSSVYYLLVSQTAARRYIKYIFNCVLRSRYKEMVGTEAINKYKGIKKSN